MSKDDIMSHVHRCSFCGKPHDQVRRFVVGPEVGICNECILLCQEIISQDMPAEGNLPGQNGKLPTPAEMKKVLDLLEGDEALVAIAKKAIKRNTGARGLRSIMESVMLDVMYTGPSTEEVEEVIITEGVVNGEEKATFISKK